MAQLARFLALTVLATLVAGCIDTLPDDPEHGSDADTQVGRIDDHGAAMEEAYEDIPYGDDAEPNPDDPPKKATQACLERPRWDSAFIPLERIRSITPLGNLNPPDHTLPTEHTYIQFDAEGPIHLTLPATTTITEVTRSENKDHYGNTRTEYAFHMEICSTHHAYMIHTTDVHRDLRDLFDTEPCTYGEPSGSCTIRTRTTIQAGEVLSSVEPRDEWGGIFDLGFYRDDVTEEVMHHYRYQSRTLHIVCPYEELFTPEWRDRYLDLMERTPGHEPRCGTPHHEVGRTLSGNWFANDARAEDPRSWPASLAFAAHNVRPELQAISIGGMVGPAGIIAYDPTTSEQPWARDVPTTSTGTHCFESDGSIDLRQHELAGSLHVRTREQGSIDVAYAETGCASTDPASLTSWVTYER